MDSISNKDSLEDGSATPETSSNTKQEQEVASPSSATPHMDSGFECWIQVAGSFGLWLNTWGIINSWGAFETYYEQYLLKGHSASQIAWIGSIQTFLLFFVGILSAPFMHKGYTKAVVVAGNFLVVFGMMMTSIADKYWQLILAQGVLTGLGFGLLFLPSVGILVQYFVKKRAFAIGIAATASGVGGVIYPILFRRLVPRIGFGWSVRIVAFIALFAALVSIAIVKSRGIAPPKPADAVAKFAQNTPLLLFTAGYFLIFMACYVPPVYVGLFSISKGIASEDLAFYFLPIIMGSSAIGRLVLGYVADKTGPLNLSVLVSLACCVMTAGWIGVQELGGLVTFSVLYGIFLGSVVTLPSPSVAQLTPKEMFNTHLGLATMVDSLGLLIGTPIAGAVLRSPLGYDALQAFTVVALGIATILLLTGRVAKVGWKVERI